jgi:hypothetical protein
VQADQLDDMHDLRLGALEQQRAATATKSMREHRQVEHQRRVREDEAAHVNRDVILGAEGTRERSSPQALRAPILVSDAEKQRRAFDEIDDCENLTDNADGL